MTTGTHKPTASGNEFASLGARIVRLGHALQEPGTKVHELIALAQACGIKLQMRMVAESEGRSDG